MPRVPGAEPSPRGSGYIRKTMGIDLFEGNGAAMHGVSQEVRFQLLTWKYLPNNAIFVHLLMFFSQMIVRSSLATWETKMANNLSTLENNMVSPIDLVLSGEGDTPAQLKDNIAGLFNLPVCRWPGPNKHTTTGISAQVDDIFPDAPPCKCGYLLTEAAQFLNALGYGDQDLWCRRSGVLSCVGDGYDEEITCKAPAPAFRMSFRKVSFTGLN